LNACDGQNILFKPLRFTSYAYSPIIILCESLTIIFFDEALKNTSAVCTETNFGLDRIWECE
jgi:hypothetical protein